MTEQNWTSQYSPQVKSTSMKNSKCSKHRYMPLNIIKLAKQKEILKNKRASRAKILKKSHNSALSHVWFCAKQSYLLFMLFARGKNVHWCKLSRSNTSEISFCRSFWCFIWQDIIRKNKLWGSFPNNTQHWVIILIPTSKLLAEDLLKLHLIKRFSILSRMDLCKVYIIGGRLRNEGYLLFSELP